MPLFNDIAIYAEQIIIHLPYDECIMNNAFIVTSWHTFPQTPVNCIQKQRPNPELFIYNSRRHCYLLRVPLWASTMQSISVVNIAYNNYNYIYNRYNL